jgi:hypothetical protein
MEALAELAQEAALEADDGDDDEVSYVASFEFFSVVIS